MLSLSILLFFFPPSASQPSDLPPRNFVIGRLFRWSEGDVMIVWRYSNTDDRGGPVTEEKADCFLNIRR